MMNHGRHTCVAATLLILVAVGASAQGLGFYPVEELGILDPDNLDVDVNLEGSALLIAAGAMEEQDPRLKELVSSLTRVRVQVGSVDTMDPMVVADRIAGAVDQLEAKGWTRVVQVEDGAERVYIYSIDGGDGTIAGLTALVNDGGDEAVVANIAGAIDPVLLGSMMTRLGDIDFDQFIPDDG
jgi:hypothetical protein